MRSRHRPACRADSRINHSCVANVRLEFASHAALRVVALRDLESGEELVDNYMAEVGDAPHLRHETRVRLRERWRFECDCARCQAEGPLPPAAQPSSTGAPPVVVAAAAIASAPVVASCSDASNVLLAVNNWDGGAWDGGGAPGGGWGGGGEMAAWGGGGACWGGGEPAGWGGAW